MAREMKDSGIEWIGKIPERWELRKGKNLYDITTGKLDANAETQKGEYPFFTCSMRPKRISTYSFDCEALLVAGNGLVGFTQYYSGKFDAYQRTYVLSNFRDCDPIFLKHYVSNNLSIEVEPKSIGSVISFIKLGDLQNFNVSLPPIDEQKRIAIFLDTQCALIDSVIEKTRAAIEEYKMLKQAVITQAVTKGIRPNREMRDSGIEWIGETPEEWNILKIKYLFTIKKDIAGEEGYQVLSITQRGIKPKDLSKNEGQLAANYSNYQIVSIGDFAMNHMDLLTGWVDVSNYYGVTSPDYRVFRLLDIEKNSSRYYLYLMQLCYFNRVFYGLGQGVSGMGRWRLQADKFLNMYIVNPPIDEQSEIVAYLDEKTAAIDSLIQKKEQLISELEAYKKSLIYEYVTGKKEVPQATNRIEFSTEFKIALLMCRILELTPCRGRTHLQKSFFALDVLLNLFSDTQYYRFQHGPYDINIEDYEQVIEDNGWVKVKREKAVKYIKTADFKSYRFFYNKVFGDKDSEIQRICRVFDVPTTKKAEKMATVLASWNDFLIDSITPTDEMIVNDIITNWTENKANINTSTWYDILSKLKEQGLIPKGFGKKTLRKEESKNAH